MVGLYPNLLVKETEDLFFTASPAKFPVTNDSQTDGPKKAGFPLTCSASTPDYRHPPTGWSHPASPLLLLSADTQCLLTWQPLSSSTSWASQLWLAEMQTQKKRTGEINSHRTFHLNKYKLAIKYLQGIITSTSFKLIPRVCNLS
jgi:hypothetical protein